MSKRASLRLVTAGVLDGGYGCFGGDYRCFGYSLLIENNDCYERRACSIKLIFNTLLLYFVHWLERNVHAASVYVM